MISTETGDSLRLQNFERLISLHLPVPEGLSGIVRRFTHSSVPFIYRAFHLLCFKAHYALTKVFVPSSILAVLVIHPGFYVTVA